VKLFQDIEAFIQPEVPGWASLEKAQALAAIILALRPQTVIEIGVFGGKSLIPMAMALKETGTGTIYGIDPWSAPAAVEGQVTTEDKAWWATLDYEGLYQGFLKRVDDAGVRQYVSVQRMTSRQFAEKPMQNIQVLHVDGNHGPDAISDVNTYAPMIEPGGICIMDDCAWAGGYVRNAVEDLENIGFKMLYTLDTGAVFQRAK